MRKRFLFMLLMSVACCGAAAQEIYLWPEGVPGAKNIGDERFENGRTFAVSRPSLTVFAASTDRASGTAVIVAPGGGYDHLATVREGEQHTRWLNALGVTVFLLKYRLAEFGHPAPLQAILRAVRLVRAQAARYHVDPGRIGVMGSSAGGHLAACALTLFDHPSGRTGADLDDVSSRPDFGILVYPVITLEGPATHKGSRRNLLGLRPSAELAQLMSPERQVTSRTPPTLLIHTQEDKSVPVENSILFYQALVRNDIPAEMFLFEKGNHGMGLRPGLGTASDWPRRFADWLYERKLIQL